MARVVLIYPIGGSMLDVVSRRIPLGLLAVAAFLDKDGYDVKIIDQRVDKDWKKTLLNELKLNPICVGLSCSTGKQLIYAVETCQFIKENSTVPIVWGGVHPSTLPLETLENKYIDILVIGEGDITFYELVKALEKNKKLDSVKGIYYKQDSKIKKTADRELIEDLDTLPDLPFHLVNVHDYSSVDYTGGPSIDLITSKGCPFRCGFCYNLYFNNGRWRAFSVERTIKMIKFIVEKYKIKDIHFVDDNLGGSQKHFMDFVRAIIDNKLNIAWGTNGLRVNNVTSMSDEDLKLLEKSGCKELGIGIESGNQDFLNLMNKAITLEQIMKQNKRLAGYTINIKYTFIIGMPTETKKDIDTTVKLALDLAKENPNAWTRISPYMPFPGTEMYDFAIQHGFRPPKNLEGWAKFNSLDSWHNYFGSWMSKDMIDYTDSIAFLSSLYNKNIRYKITSKTMRLLFDCYRPFAKFRLEKSFHKFPIELQVNKFIEKAGF